MTYVADTHALVWFLEGSPRRGMVTQNALSDTAAQVVVSTILLAEITFLCARHCIVSDLPHVLAHVASAAVIIVAIALVFRDVLRERTAVATKDADITCLAQIYSLDALEANLFRPTEGGSQIALASLPVERRLEP